MSNVEGEGKHAVLENPATSCPEAPPPGVFHGGAANNKLYALLAAPFYVILNYVLRITEASEDRIYESGNRKISE